MRTFSRWVVVATLVCGAAAHAVDINDISYRQIRTRLGNPAADTTANGRFRAMARTLGAVITSANLMPPETLGHAGFALNTELSTVLASSEYLPTDRNFGSNPLLVPSIHVRKGLPFSTELGARLGWIDRSGMFMATGEVKAAVIEGFNWVYIPDVGVRLHATRLFGQRYFDLTAAGLDIGVSKQFAVGGMVTFTPYAGLDFVGVASRSERIDFEPSRDYAGTVPAEQDGDPRGAGEFNTAAYKTLNLMENLNTRVYGGLRFIGGPIQLGAEVSVTSPGVIPAAENNGMEWALPSVTAFNATFGLDF
jgi:hypothetical protein